MGGSRGVGPWKLLACLGSLRAAGKLSAPMVASLMLQFLTIMAQRAHRKQEKLNRMCALQREALLPLLHRVASHLDAVPGTEAAKVGLEDFVSGRETGKLGDTIASVLKVLVSVEPKTAVALLLKDCSEEIVELLPRSLLLPHTCYPPVATHIGACCATCNTEPIAGPRFHEVSSGIDLCGECYIDFPFDASTKFECHLGGTPCDAADPMDPLDAWKEGMKARNDGAKCWQELAGACFFAKMAMKGLKGKGKGKFKGKGWGKHCWNPCFAGLDGGAESMAFNEMLQPWRHAWGPEGWHHPPDWHAAHHWPAWGWCGGGGLGEQRRSDDASSEATNTTQDPTAAGG